MKKRVGLIGLGRHMKARIYPTLETMNAGHLVFGYDIDPERQSFFCESHRLTGIARGELSQKMQDVDRLITALPPTESTEVLTECGKTGVPLYLEKPGLRSTDDFKAAKQLLGVHQDKVSMGFNFRFAPSFVAARRHLKNSRTGPYLGTLRFLSRHPSSDEWGSRTPLEAWFRNNGVHAFDLVHWLFGPPDEARMTRVSWADGRFLASCQIGWKNGSDIRIELGNATKGFQLALSVQCGALTRVHIDSLSICSSIDLETGFATELSRDAEMIGISKAGYSGALHEFVVGAHGTTKQGATLNDGENAMRLAERLLASAHNFDFEPRATSEHG